MHVLNPLGVEPREMTKDDVWGNKEKGVKGMIVSSSFEPCKYFHDVVPYKSVTAICMEHQIADVLYWLEYVHGGGSLSATRKLGGADAGRIALRSDYQCW